MAEWSLKRLGEHDVTAARQLNGLFANAFADHETYGADRPDDAYLRELLAREHIVVLVALITGEVAGGLVAYEFDKLESRRREFYIYDLAVDEAHRRKGIATALIGWLREHARSRGGWVVFVQADHGDDPAISLYGKLGVREEVLHFDIAVN